MNKKIIRPLLSVLLALVLAVGALPLSVFADDIDDGSSALLSDVSFEDITEPIVEDSGEGSDALPPENPLKSRFQMIRSATVMSKTTTCQTFRRYTMSILRAGL